MDDLLHLLGPKEQRGSKPRCHLLLHGTADEVAARLTSLAAPFASVSRNDHWMPKGFENLNEAELDKAPLLVEPKIGAQLRDWWLAVVNPKSKTPNFDIASTCAVENKPGLLIIEAKAHEAELSNEIVGKKFKAKPSDGSKANHDRIGVAIQSASDGLQGSTSISWKLSRDSHYQLSNRFAWAWKLTELGLPVVLIYLGFLNANEMKDKGKPFADDLEWQELVKKHSEPLFPASVWNHQWKCNGEMFVPLIKSTTVELPGKLSSI